MNRIILIVIIVVVAVGLFVGGYYIRQSMNRPAGPNTGSGGNLPDTSSKNFPAGATTTQGYPAAGSDFPGQKLSLVAQNPVYDYFASTGGTKIIQPDGQIVEIRGSQVEVLSGTAIDKLLGAAFSYDGTKALISFGEPTSPQVSVFDLANKTWQPLTTSFREFAWSPSENKFAHLAPKKNGGVSLSITDLKSPKITTTEILSLRAQDLTVRWNSTNKIILSGKPSSLTENSVWGFDIKKQALSQLLEPRIGLDSLWSNDDSLGLSISVSPQGDGRLDLVDASNGTALQELNFLTRPDKCIFWNKTAVINTDKKSTSTMPASGAQKYLDCAVPINFKVLSGQMMIDDYQKEAMFTADSFYSINLGTGSTTALFTDTSRDLDAIRLKIFGSKLFFVSRLDQKLYSLSLE